MHVGEVFFRKLERFACTFIEISSVYATPNQHARKFSIYALQETNSITGPMASALFSPLWHSSPLDPLSGWSYWLNVDVVVRFLNYHILGSLNTLPGTQIHRPEATFMWSQGTKLAKFSTTVVC